MLSLNLKSRRSRGFTLIELLVVLVILAAVAGLVIPKLGYVEEQAGNATAAAATSQLVSNLETYKASAGSYPLGMDTLLNSTGTALYANLWEHGGTSLGFPFGPKQYLEVLDSTGYVQSLGHAFSANAAGEVYVYDHTSSASVAASDSGTVRRLLDYTSSSAVGNLAFVKPYASVPPGPPTIQTFINTVYKAAGYPSGPPAGTRLIALGVGPNAGSIGETMATTPSHGEQDPQYYGRFIAIFAVHESGKSAALRTVIDSQGVSVGANIQSYKDAGPSHE